MRISVQGPLDRNREVERVQHFADNFHHSNPLYPPYMFPPSFRVSRPMFLAYPGGNVETMIAFNAIQMFLLRFFPSCQKCTTTFQMLASYGIADVVDEYMRTSESTCLESMYMFCKGRSSIKARLMCLVKRI
jgi:hypothetical protein